MEESVDNNSYILLSMCILLVHYRCNYCTKIARNRRRQAYCCTFL